MESAYEIVFILGLFLIWVFLIRPIFMKDVNLMKGQKGVTMVEYAILLALIAIAVATAFPSITTAIRSVFQNASSAMIAKP